MNNHAISSSDFPTIDEIKYVSLVERKISCVVYTGMIPLIFLVNPKRIDLRAIPIASGYGMIFFRPGAEGEVQKISNIFDDFDRNYANFQAAGWHGVDEKSSSDKSNDTSTLQKCAGFSVPTGIDPHEGIEYALMQKKLKNVALFEHFIPVEFITDPLGLEMKYIDYKEGMGRIYYLPGFEISALELKKELSKAIAPYDEHHIRLVGRLLGYQHTDIEQFLALLRKRDDFYA
ncbi:hypothetical protein ACR6A7_19770 [Pantoea sp. RRHST58]|uniref:hypothetical protein n=1 Tax=Pantoea sp. RRHST58 TaxID=3425183 RepID=UPI003DA186BE